ncbi:5-methylcytosine-specific restriction endonuclease system specificity protein McrC [Oscillatoria laete-virens NRMC-F 0139]|nr:5-methylcytosine-specific restriction endonuclease system specificity protein McrC [Oscillatoria laete-virens]MDL5052164.1 5-methylcytosine-specific restriction endonuclease system specificity protein McrC [Oscillatoria laete-virens NRMC-F 0139]
MEKMAPNIGAVDGIPVRNLWLLMLYASKLYKRFLESNIAVEEMPDDIPDLVARILTSEVERRLRRNLTAGYKVRNADLNRVRGRIDILRTERHLLLERGSVACKFDDLTFDTPRNRLVRAALLCLSKLVRGEVLRSCRLLANTFGQFRVRSECPTRSELSTDRFGRHDSHDQVMVAAAQLAFNLALPTETAGTHYLYSPSRESHWVRKLFEKGVGGFYRHTLDSKIWRVQTSRPIKWPKSAQSPGISAIFPEMETDIVIDRRNPSKRTVIDTKFTSIVKPGLHRENSLRSAYVYQIYAYLRSQEDSSDPLDSNAEGILLHPSVGTNFDEWVDIQGHRMRFVTVDLSVSAKEICTRLRQIIGLS